VPRSVKRGTKSIARRRYLKREAELRSSTPLKRRKRGKLEPADKTASEAFYVATTRGGECAVGAGHVTPTNPLQAHHVTPQEKIREYARTLGAGRLVLRRLLWDKRNGLPLCRRCHDLHTRAVTRVPLKLVPAGAVDFARELELDYLLERNYTTTEVFE
jgi:hypothetical protein